MVNKVNKFIMPNGDEIRIDGLYGKITNCLLEVPQKIKLELNNGTLTLKAGSQVIIPNGFEADGITPKFDYVTIESDVIANTPYTNEPIFIYYRNNEIQQAANNAQCSGTSSTVNYGYWYDTTNNLINRINSGEVSYSDLSFPLAIINASNGSWASIDQVFNGMGYIGSTVWVDKGVKGLIPNGRNEDGSLRNIEFTTDNLTTVSVSDPIKYFGIKLEGSLRAGVYGDWLYNENLNTVQIGNVTYAWMYAGTLTYSNGKITSFNPKQPFRAVDYSDSSEVAGWGMPSDKYIDLTLGASGTTYTAPANGWFVASARINAGGWIGLWVNSTFAVGKCTSSVANTLVNTMCPVNKGDVVQLQYANYASSGEIVFVYAQGEV